MLPNGMRTFGIYLKTYSVDRKKHSNICAKSKKTYIPLSPDTGRSKNFIKANIHRRMMDKWRNIFLLSLWRVSWNTNIHKCRMHEYHNIFLLSLWHVSWNTNIHKCRMHEYHNIFLLSLWRVSWNTNIHKCRMHEYHNIFLLSLWTCFLGIQTFTNAGWMNVTIPSCFHCDMFHGTGNRRTEETTKQGKRMLETFTSLSNGIKVYMLEYGITVYNIYF